jgi:uncharacterized oligopeptide transporter (OPT) family protein
MKGELLWKVQGTFQGRVQAVYCSRSKSCRNLQRHPLVLGIILAIVFGGANAYLGLRVGMTISASIPAAVISMGIIRLILKKDSILENNMVQTIGSAGESLAAGVIFTMPAIFMWVADGHRHHAFIPHHRACLHQWRYCWA